MHLSIVIPAYNEEKRIGATLSKIAGYLHTKKYEYEVIISDDGSSDNTVEAVQDSTLFHEGKLRIVSSDSNKGKGSAVKNGILNSYGDHLLFADADLSTPVEELDKLLTYVDKGYDIVIGSRAVSESTVAVHQPWYRECMGKGFNFLVKLMLFKEFNDTQCGFKLFKGDCARRLAQYMKIDGFCFDVEMLYLASKMGYKIAEVGVSWENSPESKVRLVNSSLGMFLDLFRIKSIHSKI